MEPNAENHPPVNRPTLTMPLPPVVSAALDDGATVITANQRSARSLRYAFDLRQRDQGLTVWQPAPILPWEAWTASLWQSLLLTGEATEMLLSPAQEHTLWREILSSDPDLYQTLQSPDSLAELASEAWSLLARYRGQTRLRSSWPSPETRALQRWATEFERRIRAQRLLPRASLEETLSNATEAGHLRIDHPLALIGFDVFTPAQQRLLEALRSTETPIETLSIEHPAQQRQIVQTSDKIAEIESAALWARRLLRSDPSLQIAIVTPDLEARRSAIDRIFREILAPQLEDIQANVETAPYEFSLGIPLVHNPMVRIALDLIQWSRTPLAVERISALLVSPLFAMIEEERSARASFDVLELRRARLLLPEVSIASLVDLLRRSRRRQQLSHLIRVLEAMARISTSPEPRTHAAWSDHIRTLLATAQWGRHTGEDSVEFQARQRWENSLDVLATLDFNGSLISFNQALRELILLTGHTLFAPESHHAPVQIMGPLEAAGSSFDALWFLGAGDLEWPTAPVRNPLLPWPLQRELGLPGSDAAADNAHALLVAKRIASSAPVVLFSYAAESSDGTQRPSPLLRSLHLNPVSVEEIADPIPSRLQITLEEFTDSTPIPPLPDHAIAGGADILKLQASCGFRAFAERRLGALELREIELGMDASERGNIVHRTLEHFWKNTRTQQQLKAMSREEREAALAESIEFGLHRASSSSAPGWEQAYIDLQRERLRSLLSPWLELELRRDPFEVRFSEEESRDVSIGPLHLNLRVDRIDLTEEGEIILDYKTGTVKASDWQGDRPDEPQLPLYAVVANAAQPETPLVNIAFGQIRAGNEMAFESYTSKIADKSTPKRQKLPFEEQLERWRIVLEDLAIAFHRGEARVDPKNYPQTCTYCAQRTLCRLNPAAFDEDLDEEAATDTAHG
jgi:ATP-dependent helicase/nuclease subunit B